MPKQQHQTVVAVFSDTGDGKKAFRTLKNATVGAKSTSLEKIPFEKLDFGETPVLDKFYSASVVVADVTDKAYQATIFYQLGLRESFGMKNNVVITLDEQLSFQSRRRASLGAAAHSTVPAVTVSKCLCCE